MRSAPAALLLAGRRTFKKCGGISADKHATACVTRCPRGACNASTTYVIDPKKVFVTLLTAVSILVGFGLGHSAEAMTRVYDEKGMRITVRSAA